MLEIDVQEEYRRLGTLYEAFDAVLAWPDAQLFLRREDVSAWSVAQHLYHILLANSRMLKAIEAIVAGHPSVQAGEPNRAGWYVLRREDMMRGRGQAPADVHPPAAPTRTDLATTRDRSRHKYEAAAALLPDLPGRPGGLPHPFLGTLSAAQWLRLARIHSAHHLAIIHDVARLPLPHEPAG
ncbi:MAG: hypothetical protein KatS3mg043_1616 [Rhodothermaceae bacterium]|nr:MAG: hypothetical protein KatS3mg043_1616 [Rhodothermaceae bacterium]